MILSLSLISGFCLSSQAALIERYSFTTDASDSISGRNGTLLGGASISNGSVLFNGSSAYVQLPTNLIVPNANFTIETWVTTNNSLGWARIFDFGGGTSNNMFLTIRAGDSNTPRYAITTNNNVNEQRVTSPTALANGTYMIALTYDSSVSTARLYVDGVQVAFNTGVTLNPGNITLTNNYLGKSQYADPFFSGSMSEFRIYDTTLAAGVISANFTAGPDVAGVPEPATWTAAVAAVALLVLARKRQ